MIKKWRLRKTSNEELILPVALLAAYLHILDKMFEEAKALAVVDKEKDDEQKKAKQAS